MAGRVSTLYVRVVGDVSQYERNMVKGAVATETFGRSVKTQEKHMLQFSRGALLGSGALAGLTRAVVFASSAFVGAYGLTYGFKSAADAAKEFQAEMELVSTQAGASGKEVERMSKALLKLAPSVGQTPIELSKGLYHLESAGIRGGAALSALKVAAKGAAIGHAGLEETVNALVGAFKSGISGAGNFGQTMAVLSSIVGAGNIRMKDLESALGTGILSAGKAFGLSIKDIGAALATLSIGAVPVEEAATRLRMSFALLGGAGTIKANKALGSIGLSTRKLANDLRSGGIVQAIGDLRDHLSNLSPTDQVRVLTSAFGGGRFSTSIITLVQNFGLLKQRLAQIEHGVRMFGPAWEKTQKTAEFATKKFQASLAVLQIEIGQALLPVMTRVFDSVSKWFDKMNRTGQLQRDIKSAISSLSLVFHEFGIVLHSLGPSIVSFTNILGGLKNTVIALGLAWLGMKTGLLPALGSLAKGTALAGASGVASMSKVGATTEATTADVYALSAASRAATVSLGGMAKSEAAATKSLYGSPAGIPMGAKEGTVLYSQKPASEMPLVIPGSGMGVRGGRGYRTSGGIEPTAVPTSQEAAEANYGRPSGMEEYRRKHRLPPVTPGEEYVPAPLKPTYVEQTRPMIGGKPMIGPLEAVPVEVRNVKEQIDRTVYDEASRAARGMAAYMGGSFATPGGKEVERPRIPEPAGAFQGGGQAGSPLGFAPTGITNPAEAIKALKNAAATAEAEAKNLEVGSIAQKGKLNDAQELRGAAKAIEKDASNLRMVQKDWMGQKVLGADRRTQMFGARPGESGLGPYQVQIPGRRSLPIYDTAGEAYKKALEAGGRVLDSQGRVVDNLMSSQRLMQKETSLATKMTRGMGSAFSKAGSAAKSLGSSIGGQLASKGFGIGLAASIGGPMAASYLGLPKQVGSVVQGAGIGLLGSSMLGVNPLAGVAVGTGVAAGHAVGGTGGHALSGTLIGAGLGAAGAGAIAGTELGAAGGPLAPITIPVGAAVGALAGLGVSLLTMKRHSDTAADALLRLAKAAPLLRSNLRQERRQVVIARENIAFTTSQRDAAKQGVAQAKAQVRGTLPGTEARVIAIHNLRAAQAQLEASNIALADSELALKKAQGQVTAGVKSQKKQFSDTIKVFVKVGQAAMDVTRFKHGKLISVDGGGLQGYIDKMDKLGDSMEKTNPKFARVAHALAKIAGETRKLPSGKTIKVLLTHPGFAATAARLTQILGHMPSVKRITVELFFKELHAKEAAKYGAGPHHTAAFGRAIERSRPKPEKPAKPKPPHDFELPMKLQLEEAQAGTKGAKAQIKADEDLLAYTKKEIASGKLTDKGLLAAYQEEAQLQDDLESLRKKRKKRRKRSAKLSDILPPSFTSAMQRAQASVSQADATGIPEKQYGALTRLETVYQRALNFLKAEHLVGAKRLLQIKEEALLTGKIADVRKQMKQLLADAIDTARQQIGPLFGGPLLAPSEATTKAQMGMPGPDIGRLTDDMKAQTAQYRRFTGDLTKLAKRGAPKELLKELRAMGPDALPYIESLLKGGSKALKEFFKTFAKREKLIQKVAKIEMTAAHVVIHAAHLRQPNARNPAGRRGSTRRHVPARADGGMVSNSSIQNNYYPGFQDGGMPEMNWDWPRTMSGASGGVVEPVPGGVYRIAEAGHPEMVIPLDPSKRERAGKLLAQTHSIIDRADGGMIQPNCYEMGGMVEAKMMGYRDGGVIRPSFPRRQDSVNIVDRRNSGSDTIKLQIFLDGHDITNQVTVRQERKKANSVAQVRGRHYGVTPA